MEGEHAAEKPHVVWWVAHVFLGVISGLVVYVLYKDKNPAAARRHLIFSVIVWLIGAAASFAVTILIGAGPLWDDAYQDMSLTSGNTW